MTATYHHALAPGTRIESYEVNHVLGVGGFGVTYRAFDHSLQRQVAMKEYLPTGLAVRTPDGTTVGPKSDIDVENYEYGLKRFLDEARTLARFREPHIVRVIRYLEAHGTAYFVMDYEDGQPLSKRLKKAVTLSEAEILSVILPILRSLRAVHAQQFLHRDIKPGNIYVRKDGSPVLLDFGSARQALGEQSRAMTGMVTPGYAPFEQYFTKGKQGPATDLYGLGATMYHCVTGEPPVASTERIAAIQDGEPDPIGALDDRVKNNYSAPFLHTLMWMLEPNARHRPQTVDQALVALEPSGDGGAAANVTRPTVQTTRATTRTDFPETVSIDELSDTDVSWQADVLRTVEANLEKHIGPLSKALVRKAAQKTSNVDELTALLSRFIPSEHDKTAFLARTQVIANTGMLEHPQPPQVAGVQRRAPARRQAPPPPATLDARLLKAAEQSLAAYVGPLARILVRRAARQTSDLDEFCRMLAQELPDKQQQSDFCSALRRMAVS